MHTRLAAFGITVLVLGCHPPPPELVEAKRVVVVVGPPTSEYLGDPYYRETPFQTLEASACATICPDVVRAGEHVTACYVLPPHALFAEAEPSPQPTSQVEVTPSLLHVCAIQ